MKKRYISPSIDVVRLIQHQPLLVDSIGSDQEVINGGPGNGDARSRSFEFFDDEY